MSRYETNVRRFNETDHVTYELVVTYESGNQEYYMNVASYGFSVDGDEGNLLFLFHKTALDDGTPDTMINMTNVRSVRITKQIDLDNDAEGTDS